MFSKEELENTFSKDICNHLAHIVEIRELMDMVEGLDFSLVHKAIMESKMFIEHTNTVKNNGHDGSGIFTKETIKKLSTLNVLLDLFKNDPEYCNMYKASLEKLSYACDKLIDDNENELTEENKHNRFYILERSIR